MRPRRLMVLLTTLALAVSAPTAASATQKPDPAPTLLATGLAGGQGSTIGPDGALYVTEPLAGRISRVDRRTGAVTPFATGLPVVAAPPGGVMDVAFLGRTAYALVTLVGTDVGGSDTVGIYRIDGPSSSSVFADIGEFSLDNPPTTDFFVPTGVQYALQPYRGGFLVTDGHHNRVLRVTGDGTVSEVVTFGNIVPTGLETVGPVVLVGQAGPVPHLPEDGRIVAASPRTGAIWPVASGARLLVDVEAGAGHLYGLSQGFFTPGNPEGSPADPDTGALMRVSHGGFRTVADGLDRPTSLEIVRGTAYVVTIDGEVWTVDLRGRHGHGSR